VVEQNPLLWCVKGAMGLDHDFEFIEQLLVASFPPKFSLINVLFFHSMNSQGHSSGILFTFLVL